MDNWITLPYTWDSHNIINQVYANKIKVQKKFSCGNRHKTCHPNHFSVYSSVSLSTFTLLCLQLPKLFSSGRTETQHPTNSNLPCPAPKPWHPAFCSPVSTNSTILGTLYERSHTVFVFCDWLMSLSIGFIGTFIHFTILVYISTSVTPIYDRWSVKRVFYHFRDSFSWVQNR